MAVNENELRAIIDGLTAKVGSLASDIGQLEQLQDLLSRAITTFVATTFNECQQRVKTAEANLADERKKNAELRRELKDLTERMKSHSVRWVPEPQKG